MDVEPTAEQLMLRDSTRAFLESRSPPERIRELAAEANGFDQDLWKRGASLGWTAMLVPEAYGGTGSGSHGIIGAAILAEEFGRMLYSSPLLQISVAADAVARVGSDAQKEAILSNLVSGASIATWAIADGPGGWDARSIGITAYQKDDGYVLRGMKRWVQDAHVATQLLVTCRDNYGVVQLLVPAMLPVSRKPISSRPTSADVFRTWNSGTSTCPTTASSVTRRVLRPKLPASSVWLWCCNALRVWGLLRAWLKGPSRTHTTEWLSVARSVRSKL